VDGRTLLNLAFDRKEQFRGEGLALRKRKG
jgi:hypothetical protein